MAKAFSIRDFMDDVRQQDESDVSEKVSIYDIGINPKNKYTMSDIEKIKDSIYALGGVQQNVILVRCPEGAEHKYLALDGHRRLAASRELVEEGYEEFELIPAVIKGQIDTDTEDAMLVLMNSTQRNKTDWEKVMEHMRLKEIIPRLKKRQGIDGRTRDIEADMLGVSRGQISIYNTIGTKLTPKLMNLFENGDIGISLAHEAAQLEPELQQKLVDITLDKGAFTEEDVRQTVGSRPIKGQMVIEINDDKNVPESGTFKEPGQMKTLDPETQYDAENKAAPPTDDEILCLYNSTIKEYDGDRKELTNILKDNLGRSYSGFHCSEYGYQFSPKGVRINFSHYTTSYAELVRRLNTLVPENENVPESGTFEKMQEKPVYTAPEEKSGYYTNNAEEIGIAIDFIFFMNDFPEDKLDELMDAFRRKEDFTNALIAAELIFKKMLPYESYCVKVSYRFGYQVEYIHDGESYCFPPYNFWKGFADRVGFRFDQNNTGQSKDAVNDTSEPGRINADNLPDISFRGRYTIATVDKQIEKYSKYLFMVAKEGNRPNQVSEYSCLLDALNLLRAGLITEEEKSYEEDG